MAAVKAKLAPVSKQTFGTLSLNRDTLRRLDVSDAPGLGSGFIVLKPAGGGGKPRSDKSNCPVTTTTRVTAHCC